MIILLLIFLIRLRRLPISTRTDTLFPYSTLFLSARRSRPHARHGFHAGDQAHPAGSAEPAPDAAVLGHFRCPDQAARAAVHAQPGGNPGRSTQFGRRNRYPPRAPGRWRAQARRSEEHTSELQSLMRISYAV